MTSALSCSARAATVPLRSLLEASPGNLGSIRLDGDYFVISKKAAAKSLLLGVASDGPYLNRVDTVFVAAQKEYLTPEERSMFRRAVIDVAQFGAQACPEHRSRGQGAALSRPRVTKSC